MESSSLLSGQIPYSAREDWAEFPARLPSCHNIASLPSCGNTPRQGDLTSEEDWTKLFEERPKDFGEKAAWLSDLEQRRGKEWYDRFFTWYLRRLHYLPRRNFPMNESNFQDYLMQLQWDPENTAMELVTERLAYASVSNAPDFSLGQYNGHTVGLVLNGSALDPPTVSTKIFDLLRVQYAHLNMFVGLRVQELTKGDLCVLTLGKSAVLAARSMHLA